MSPDDCPAHAAVRVQTCMLTAKPIPCLAAATPDDKSACCLQGPVLALADALHGHPQVVCLILKLAGDVVEANISLLEV